MNELSKKIKEIEMPKEMRERIIKNCYMEMEKTNMNKTKQNKVNTSFKKYMVAASLALCICLTGVTTLASSGKLQGYFKDIIRFDGTVVGTTYEQATDEININLITSADELIVATEFKNPTIAPYNSFETFAIETYKITDLEGNTIVKGNTTEAAIISEGKANLCIPLNNLSEGDYKLVVTEFVGNKKADQPLVITGNWEAEFVH